MTELRSGRILSSPPTCADNDETDVASDDEAGEHDSASEPAPFQPTFQPFECTYYNFPGRLALTRCGVCQGSSVLGYHRYFDIQWNGMTRDIAMPSGRSMPVWDGKLSTRMADRPSMSGFTSSDAEIILQCAARVGNDICLDTTQRSPTE